MILDWKHRLVFCIETISVGLIAILFALVCERANGLIHKMLAISLSSPSVARPARVFHDCFRTRRCFPWSQATHALTEQFPFLLC